MTDEELIKAAAQKVMGWRVPFRNTKWWVLAEEELAMFNDVQVHVHNWNPLNDEEDCWQLVDAIKARQKAAFVLGSNGHYDQWSAWIIDGVWALGRQQNSVPDHGDPHLLGSATSSDRRRAIVLACLRACAVDV